MRFVISLLASAAALGIATWLVPGIWFDGATSGSAEIADKALPLIAVAALLGLVNAFVKPVLKLLSLPIIVLTLGLFLLVVNALMLLLTSWLAGVVGLGFHVDGFLAALLGAIALAIANAVIDLVVPEP